MELWQELMEEVKGKASCPHLRKSPNSPYCAKDLQPGEPVTIDRYSVCDTASLQLWCLDPQRYHKCLFYKEGLREGIPRTGSSSDNPGLG
jgi:hypothetical protein